MVRNLVTQHPLQVLTEGEGVALRDRERKVPGDCEGKKNQKGKRTFSANEEYSHICFILHCYFKLI